MIAVYTVLGVQGLQFGHGLTPSESKALDPKPNNVFWRLRLTLNPEPNDLFYGI